MIKNRRGKKAKFLAELEENPLVERACKKLSISRATFYRWKVEDAEFRVAVELAEERGREKITDFAESKLFENMQNNQFQSLKFWLQHNTTRYSPKPTPFYEELYREHTEIVERDRQQILDRYIERLTTKELEQIILRGEHNPKEKTSH